VIPANGLLFRDEHVVGVGVGREFGEGKVGIVEVRTEAGEKDVYEFWVGFDLLCLFTNGGKTGGLPPTTR
jgi:hypothetical protein